MSRHSLLDFYREIVNSEKTFGIDYKNLSKQLIERIDKAIDYIKNNQWELEENGYEDDLKIESKTILEILGGE